MLIPSSSDSPARCSIASSRNPRRLGPRPSQVYRRSTCSLSRGLTVGVVIVSRLLKSGARLALLRTLTRTPLPKTKKTRISSCQAGLTGLSSTISVGDSARLGLTRVVTEVQRRGVRTGPASWLLRYQTERFSPSLPKSGQKAEKLTMIFLLFFLALEFLIPKKRATRLALPRIARRAPL
jgi:hypothetical protein